MAAVAACSTATCFPPETAFRDAASPGFIKLFVRATTRLGLSAGAALTLELLISYDHPDPHHGGERKGYVWPGRATLCDTLDIADRT